MAANTRSNSRQIGADTERAVAAYFRDEGWAGAERRIRTGYRTAERTVADQGDLLGLPGLCVQVKSLRPVTAAEAATRLWLAETEQQREASGAALGLLVVRRWGTTDVGRWWCWLQTSTLKHLLTGDPEAQLPEGWPDAPLRLELRDVVVCLKACGWGGTDQAVPA